MDLQRQGPVNFGTCDPRQLMEHARQVAKDMGKREDATAAQSLHNTHELRTYAEKRKGLWGKAEKAVHKKDVIYSKTIQMGDEECVVTVRFVLANMGKRHARTTGGVPRQMYNAFVAMGLAFH